MRRPPPVFRALHPLFGAVEVGEDSPGRGGRSLAVAAVPVGILLQREEKIRGAWGHNVKTGGRNAEGEKLLCLKLASEGHGGLLGGRGLVVLEAAR